LDERCRQDADPQARMNSLDWDKDKRHPYHARAQILWALRGLLHQYSKFIIGSWSPS
jgi:hypothetical protein